jgi:hypothetical protein
MKITNLNISNPALPSQPSVEESIAAADSQAAANVTGPKTYTPSSQLQQLTELVRQQPAIREDRVQTVAHRFKNGHYHTRASAEQTASSLLRALD